MLHHESRSPGTGGTAALDELTNQLLGHFNRTRDSGLVTKARRLLLQRTEPADRVLQLLVWCGSGTGKQSGYPPYEDVPGLILSHVPIAEIVTALEDPRADARHDLGATRHLFDGSREKQRLDVVKLPAPLRVRVREAAAAKGYELPQWAERLLLTA